MRCSAGTLMSCCPLTALWINYSTFDTDHEHRGGVLTKTPPPTELQIPATVTTLVICGRGNLKRNEMLHLHVIHGKLLQRVHYRRHR